MERIQILTQQTYDVYEFLYANKDTILKDIAEDVKRFLSREAMFSGVFHSAFIDAFEEFVLSSIKGILTEHFNLDYLEVECMIDRHTVEVLTGNMFFDKGNYNV